jgi:tetratricopeptide (TPR) repeat protein
LPIDGTIWPRAYWEGAAALARGDKGAAEVAFTAALRELNALGEQPQSAFTLSLYGIINAGLGRRSEAIAAGRRACELIPLDKDAIDGASLAGNLAQIYTWTGETDLAIAQLETLTRVPCDLSFGLLKLHPYWDALRGDPRFEAIVASLAPK